MNNIIDSVSDEKYFKDKLEEAKNNNDEKLIKRYTNILNNLNEATIIFNNTRKSFNEGVKNG